MFSLSAFVAYLSVLLYLNQFYTVYLVIFPLAAYLVFLEYTLRKSLRRQTVIYMAAGIFAGLLWGLFSYKKFNHQYIQSEKFFTNARIIRITSSFYILDAQSESREIYRIKLKLQPDLPKSFLFDRVDFICNQWKAERKKDFNGNLEALQSIHNTCIQGVISKTHEYQPYFNALRRSMKSAMINALNELPPGSYAKGFLLGESNDMNPVELNIFRKMGISHLFSPSGLHMGLLYASCYLPFSLARLNLAGQITGLMVCFLYLCILDFQIPLLRSFAFIVLYYAMKAINRKSDTKYTLYATSVFLEMVFPLNCFSPSFILSFFMTLVILLFFPQFIKILDFGFKHLRDNLAITLAASAGSCLVSVFFFNYYHPISVLYNFLLVPPSGIYLASTFLYIFFSPFQYIIRAGDFIFREASWFHYFILDKNFPQNDDFFLRIWLACFLFLTLFFIYHNVKKQFWFPRKYYLKFFALLFLGFFFNFFLVRHPIGGRIAYPYGIIEYHNQHLYFSGFPAPFYEQQLAYALRNLKIPFREVFAPNDLHEILYSNLVHPMQNIQQPAPKEQSREYIRLNNNCYLFHKPYYRKTQVIREVAGCENIYIVYAKKHSPDMSYYEKVYGKLNPAARLKTLNFSTWQWQYDDDPN